MAYVVDRKQHCESTATTNKRVAQTILNKRLGEIVEERFQLPNSNPPRLQEFSQEFLNSIHHQINQITKKRYASSLANLSEHFGDVRLSDFNLERIEGFKEARLLSKVRAATVNRDLAVLRRMLGIAAKKRLIRSLPFREIEMLEERKERRQPHILTFDEEERLLRTAAEHIRVLSILILETGLRSGKEALPLKWTEIDFLNESIRVRQSKTMAGQRIVPMSDRCKAELLRWQGLFGPNFSEYVFPKPGHPETHLRDVRANWANALSAAGLKQFWIYDLRHTFCSRVIQAGVSSIFAAQIMGHSKLEALREAHSAQSTGRQLVQ
jgi:integrase